VYTPTVFILNLGKYSDICDLGFDKDVERCKTRPLPSGMIRTTEAIIAFICWVPFTLGITWATLGPAVMISFIPVWVLSAIYPFMKRIIPFPQVVLGITIGGAVFPGWVGITHELDHLEQALPLFFATASWVVYFDIFYATQDSPDDKKIGVKSLAVLMGDHVWILLTALGVLQAVFFAVTALRANLSLIFWLLGLGVWVVSVPWHIMSFDLKDRHSGGRIFKANIKLGLYLTGISLLELFLVRVYHVPLTRLDLS
jgi:6-methylsalicylate decarboxylase